jgi:exportin-7
MNLTDSRLTQGGCEKLELAMLSFFEQFRKIYVSDQVSDSELVNTFLLSILSYLSVVTIRVHCKQFFFSQVQKNSKVYRRLSEVLGLSDESMILSVFVRKM